MIQKGTKIKCSDNSGANIVKCVSIYGCIKRYTARVGSVIKLSIKNFRKKKKMIHEQKRELKKKIMYWGVITSTKQRLRRRDGLFFKSDRTKVVILSNTQNVFATKVRGVVAKELKSLRFTNSFQKLILMAKFIL